MYYINLTIQIIILLSFSVFFILFINSIINSVRFKVPQVWTFPSDFRVMKKWLWKYKLSWKNLVDLWSGSWKALRFFEKEFWTKSTWYEIDFSNVIISKIIWYILWNKSKIIKWDYLKADLSDYDIVYVYWFTVLMPWIEKKLWNNCKKWTLVISNAFKMPNKKAINILLNNSWKEEIYIYKI
jgi:hypothetical protein